MNRNANSKAGSENKIEIVEEKVDNRDVAQAISNNKGKVVVNAYEIKNNVRNN